MTATFDAIVTGAASGIGKACALRIAAEGYRVLAVDKNEAGMAEVAAAGADAMAVDLSDPAQRDLVVARSDGVRYLVNAAGIIRVKPILESGIEDMRAIFPINIEAVWDLMSRIGRNMPVGGAIVNLSSASAKLSLTTEVAVYAISKTAVMSMTRSFAIAFAPQGVRVNCLVPGIIDTPMQDAVIENVALNRGYTAEGMAAKRLEQVPLGRTGTPEETANVAWFLLSDEARYMTGQAINVTGGHITW
jgi:NAD(P)-dependent dehydrogenase (short-subunit alcohol dehydrogenase family)